MEICVNIQTIWRLAEATPEKMGRRFGRKILGFVVWEAIWGKATGVVADDSIEPDLTGCLAMGKI
ncbi:MAG: hypothetical protein ACP5D7_10010 [Limnospira sp.]